MSVTTLRGCLIPINMKLSYLPMFMFLCLVPVASAGDIIDKVADLIKQGNIHELSNLFAPQVDVSILSEENNYSKTQAELVIDRFFNDNRPKAVKLLHKVNSNPNYQFGVIIMTTAKVAFRVTYTLKGSGTNLMLIELRIEADKSK